ncbi:MAG: PAS domain S-box protein [bacterium]|nr:PAS domain S-box protein [bacterium]
MIVYFKKIHIYRKQKKISLDELCSETDIGRTTIWKWEKGKSFPKERHIRLIAKILDVTVDKISDLKPKHPLSDTDLSDTATSWVELSDNSSQTSSDHFHQLNKILTQLKLKLDNASLIIRGLMNAIPSEVYIKDKNQKYVIANYKFTQTFSLVKDFDFIGKKDKDFFNKNEAEFNEAEDTNVLLSGTPIVNREGFMPGSRKKKWSMISKLPIFDTKNNIEGIIAVFFDISERKHNEELREQLEINLNNMSEGIVIYDEETMEYLYFNKASAEIHGYTLDEYSKMSLLERINKYMHPEDVDKKLQFLNKVWTDILKYRIIKPNGEVRWIEAHHSKSYFMSKKCVIAVFFDITEKKYNEGLKEELEINLNNMSEGIIIFDKKTNKHLYVNKASAKMHGYTLDKFSKMQHSTLRGKKYIHPKDINIIEEYFKENNWTNMLRYRIIRPNGEVRWIESHHSKSYFMSKKCIVSVLFDITETYKAIELREVFEKNINLTGYALIIFNTENSKIVYTNMAVKDVYGYESSILTNSNIDFFVSSCIHPDSKQKILSCLNQKILSLDKIKCITPDGKIKNLECKLFIQKYLGEKCLVLNSKIITE